MKPLYTPTEFDRAKSRDKLSFECEHCHAPFYVTKNEIQKSVARHKSNNPRRNSLKYCSKRCSHSGRHNGEYFSCKTCGKTVYRTPKELKKVRHTFCSSSCSAKYHNAHKTTGCRRSKLEMWIEKELSRKYPLLSIKYNKTEDINAELDIFIPSLKLAFELNGIFHYEPIFGLDKLKSHQFNDNRKFQACLESGIELCIIDTSSQRKFTPKASERFIDIVENIIQKKMGYATSTDLAPQASQA